MSVRTRRILIFLYDGYQILFHVPALEKYNDISLFLKFQPDIILMDIRMPEVNGYEATEAIRQMSATVPIIALTAFAYEEDRQKIMHSGFTDFLTKPISSKVLLGKLESLKKI